MFKRKNKPLIQFVSTVEGIEDFEEIRPKPSKMYVPDWFKEMPISPASVRNCPSFPDFFSQGYILPMWMDSELIYDEKTQDWFTGSSPSFNDWTHHPKSQFLDYTQAYSPLKQPVKYVFKANSPWKLITPPGYSVMQLPLYYDFNADFSVLPGIIDTDINHEMNQQVTFLSSKKNIVIKRGTPFVMYVPFKRTKYDLSVRGATQEDIKKFVKTEIYFSGAFTGSGAYRKMQRERDKNNEQN